MMAVINELSAPGALIVSSTKIQPRKIWLETENPIPQVLHLSHLGLWGEIWYVWSLYQFWTRRYETANTLSASAYGSPSAAHGQPILCPTLQCMTQYALPHGDASIKLELVVHVYLCSSFDDMGSSKYSTLPCLGCTFSCPWVAHIFATAAPTQV